MKIAFRWVGNAILFGVFLFGVANAQQIAPNPNPAGNAIDLYGYNSNDQSYFNYGTLTNRGTLDNNTEIHNFGSGTLANYGTLNNNSIIDEDGLGLLINYGTGTLNNHGFLFCLNSASCGFNYGIVNNYGSIYGYRQLTNYGTLNNYAGGSTNSVPVANYGTLNNSGLLNWVGSVQNNYGTLTNDGTGTMNGGDATFNNSGAFINSGSNINTILNNSGALTNNQTGTIYSSILYNVGKLSNSGTLTIGNNLNNTGTLSILSGAKVDGTGTYNQVSGTTKVDGSLQRTAVNISGGVLQGVGTITADVTANGGVLAPGDSVGMLTIIGNLSFLNGSLDSEIGANGSDLLHVTEGASFTTGTFDFTFVDGFHPISGGSWTFLTADGGVTGWESLNVLLASGASGESGYITSDGHSLTFNYLAPVPLPASIWLMLSSLGGLGFLSRRYRPLN